MKKVLRHTISILMIILFICLSNSSYSPISFALTFEVLGKYLNDNDYLSISEIITKNYPRSDSIRIVRRKELQETRIEMTEPTLAYLQTSHLRYL